MKKIVIMLLFATGFHANAVYVDFDVVLNDFKFDQVINDSDLTEVIKNVRSREIPNSGTTTDCHILAEISRYKEFTDKDEYKQSFSFDIKSQAHINLINFCGLKLLQENYDKDTTNKIIQQQLQSLKISLPRQNQPTVSGSILAGHKVMALNLTTLPKDRRSKRRARISQWITANGQLSLNIQDVHTGDTLLIWVDNEFGEEIAEQRLTVGSHSSGSNLDDPNFGDPSFKDTKSQDIRPPIFNQNYLLIHPYTNRTNYIRSLDTNGLGEPNLLIRFYANITSNPVSELTPIIEFSLDSDGKLPTFINDQGNLQAKTLELDKEAANSYQIFAKEPHRTTWVKVGTVFGEDGLTRNEEGHLIFKKDPYNQTTLTNPGGYYKSAALSYFKFTGPLFDSLNHSVHDVIQGSLSDCYFAGTMRALAYYYPEILQNDIIKKNEQLSTPERDVYTVRFYKLDEDQHHEPATSEILEYHVDSYLPATSSGTALYMRGTYKKPFEMELWGPLIEKAYVLHRSQHKNKSTLSYEFIGGENEGQNISFVLNSLVGGDTLRRSLYYHNTTKTQFIEDIEKHYDFQSNKFKGPVLADSAKDSFMTYKYQSDENIIGDHQYIILDYNKSKEQLLVTNPWGQLEPVQDGNDDGVFWVPIDTIYRNFEYIVYYNL